jgi:hypothetical protein
MHNYLIRSVCCSSAHSRRRAHHPSCPSLTGSFISCPWPREMAGRRAPSLLDVTGAPSLLDLRAEAAAPALPVQEVQGKQPAREVAAADPAGAHPSGINWG